MQDKLVYRQVDDEEVPAAHCAFRAAVVFEGCFAPLLIVHSDGLRHISLGEGRMGLTLPVELLAIQAPLQTEWAADPRAVAIGESCVIAGFLPDE